MSKRLTFSIPAFFVYDVDGLAVRAIKVASQWTWPFESKLLADWSYSGSAFNQTSSCGVIPWRIEVVSKSRQVRGPIGLLFGGTGWGRRGAMWRIFQLQSGDRISFAWWWRAWAEWIHDKTAPNEWHSVAMLGSVIPAEEMGKGSAMILRRHTLRSVPHRFVIVIAIIRRVTRIFYVFQVIFLNSVVDLGHCKK